MSEPMMIEPEIGVPFLKSDKYPDLKKRVIAACNTALLLEEFGLEVEQEPTEVDNEIVATLATAYAEDPERASRAATIDNVSTLSPVSMLLTGAIMKEFGRQVVKDSTRIRHLVTNKLVVETENKDARIRLRALELLGKIDDVSLFTEKSEHTVVHKTATQMRTVLKEKLHRLISPDEEHDIIDVPVD